MSMSMNLRQITALHHAVRAPNATPDPACWDDGRINGIAWRTCVAVILRTDPEQAPAWHWAASVIHLRANGRPTPQHKYTKTMTQRAGTLAYELLQGVGVCRPRFLVAPAGVILMRPLTPEEIASIPSPIIA